MEERLPMMFIVMPPWFEKTYPVMSRNLKQNAKRLTTPFDMFETFKHLLKRTPNTLQTLEEVRAYSLFDAIPEERDCTSASVETHWCTCSSLKPLPKDDQMIVKAAEYLINTINGYLESSKYLCHTISIDEIQSSYKLIPSSKDLGKIYNGAYQLTVLVKPGGAIFEATIRVKKGRQPFSISGDISRINAYGKQKRCKVNYILEKMCFCR